MMDDNQQRWKNFILFKCYLTDKEMNEFAPFMGIIVFIVIVAFVIIACCQ